MVETTEDIKIVEPSEDCYAAYIKACEQVQTYLNDDTINDPVGKRETAEFIFAQDKYQVNSQKEFKDKIVDFYKNKRELEVFANNQSLNRENSPEFFYFITKGNEIIGSVNARPLKMDKFDRENGVKSCEKWHAFSPETGVRVTTSTVILHQYKGHGYAGEAKKQLFDNLYKNGIKEVVANAMDDNVRSNKVQKKLLNNYGGFSYVCNGINGETGETAYAHRYVVSTDTSGNSKKLYINKKVEYVMDEVNREQEKRRKESGYVAPQFVAHATHVSQEDFKASVPHLYEERQGVEIVPAFAKATQNELSAFKDMLGTLTNEEVIQLQQNLPKHPKRVFAIATKTDSHGNTLFDENGVPVPQDGSYAYSLKKCSASINFVDEGIPLLIGFQEKYTDFEKGKKVGHIYIGKGDSFKAEYDSVGNITEYTSSENMMVAHHLKTTPKDAMKHNVQFVMFNTVADYEKWGDKVQKLEKEKGEKFQTFLSSDGLRVTSLQNEIISGKAVFINATHRGCNPKIDCLVQATTVRNSLLQQKHTLTY